MFDLPWFYYVYAIGIYPTAAILWYGRDFWADLSPGDFGQMTKLGAICFSTVWPVLWPVIAIFSLLGAFLILVEQLVEHILP